MAKERTQSGKLGEWSRLNASVQANSADLPYLETLQSKLAALQAQGVDLTKEQGALRASKQEKSQALQAVIAEGSRLATLLRSAVKQHYGPGSEKLAEFGVQPFRGRKVKPAAGPAPEAPHTPPAGTAQ